MTNLLAAIAAFACATLAIAGDNVWTSVGPEGGLIRQVVVAPSAPNILYAVGHGGAWKSVDAGATWSAARSGITELTLQGVAVDPTNAQVVYAASILGGGVFKTSDGGTTWTQINNGIALTEMRSLAVDPVNPANVYAGTSCCGIFKSTNAGTSWTKLEGGLPSTSVWAIVIDPASPSTVYAGTQSQGVYKSTNGGATWVAVNTGLTSSNGGFNQLYGLAIDPAATGTLYAATGGAIFKTTNGGASWAASNGALVNPQVVSLVVNPQTPSTMYIGTTGGVRRSSDGGATWVLANAGLTSLTANTLAIDPANPARVYGGTAVGIVVTANGGTDWVISNAGLNNSTIQALVVDPSNPSTVYAGTAVSGVQKSIDGGATWNASNTGMPTSQGARDIRALAIDPSNPATIYAGNGAGIFKTTDSGASWRSIENGALIRNISSIVINPKSPSTVHVSTFFTGVFLSTNGGDTWATENNGLPPPLSVKGMAASDNSLLAITPSGGVFRSVGAASSAKVGPVAGWESFRDGIADGALLGSITSVSANPVTFMLAGFESPLAAVEYLFYESGGGDRVAATTTPGRWLALALPPPLTATTCTPVRALAAVPESGAYAGTACGVLFVAAATRQIVAVNNGMPPNLQINSIAVTPSGNDLYAGAQGGGVFRYTKSGAATPVTVVEYYNQTLDHYFITWVPAEQANLDAGNTPTRWARTGLSFNAYTTPQAGASPVCRYYIPPNLGDSHFFGRGTQECTATGQKNPSFTLESPDFMQLFLPTAGTCPAGTINVYRVFSNRPDANHRYMTDPAVRAQMVARGWQVEGDGPDAVVMCAPQ